MGIRISEPCNHKTLWAQTVNWSPMIHFLTVSHLISQIEIRNQGGKLVTGCLGCQGLYMESILYHCPRIASIPENYCATQTSNLSPLCFTL